MIMPYSRASDLRISAHMMSSIFSGVLKTLPFNQITKCACDIQSVPKDEHCRTRDCVVSGGVEGPGAMIHTVYHDDSFFLIGFRVEYLRVPT